MSTDAQLRKRKDNKKKRKDDDPQNEDVNIHIHKEGGTGGGICAKIVFIFLSCALIVLIGLIIKENHGLTELENIESESRFAQAFEGWIEEHVEDHSPEDLSQDDSEHTEHSEEASEETNIDNEEEEHESEEAEASQEEEEEEIQTEENEESEEGDESQLESTESLDQSENEEIDVDLESTEDQEKEDEEEEEKSSKKSKRSVAEFSKEISLDSTEDNESLNASVNDKDDIKEDSTEDSKNEREDVIEDETSSTAPNKQLDEGDIQDENEIHQKLSEDPNETKEKSGVSTKVGVGLALLVVAYKVFLRKRTSDSDSQAPRNSRSIEQPFDLGRRNTIIPPPTLTEIEPDLNQIEDQGDYSGEDYSEGEREEDHHKSPREDYEELRTCYSRSLTPEGDFVSKHEVEDLDDLDYGEEEYLEEELSEEEIESPEDDDDEELLKRLEAKYGKIGRDVTVSSDDAEYDSDKKSDDEYEFSNITNPDDRKIKNEIDEAQGVIGKNAAYANKLFDALLAKHPTSPRILYGKAKALDILADQRKSNDLLKLAVSFYAKVMVSLNVPDVLFIEAAERYIDRQTFLGNYKRTIPALQKLIERFPLNKSYLNKLVVTYLTMNEIEAARKQLNEMLDTNPDDGFALVHLGFVLKTFDNNFKEAIKYLEKGLKSNEPAVQDGRFYYHLGDALIRLGRKNDALKVFEDGVKNNALMSKYQRSLYNVPNLTAKPWWSLEDLPKHKDLIRTLKSNWKTIQKEALSILDEKGYFLEEKENLRELGDWKQLDLFVRGQKIVKNCAKTPVTCSIIQMFPDASKCKRGQTKFSIMHPNTHVWAHCGPTNTRLRMHLGLVVPEDTYIRVAEDTRSWKEGDVIIFDDSFEHEVWHNGSSLRLILIVDLWHPDLTDALKKSLSAI